MTPRPLLLITFHFPPSAASGAFRMLGFARHLPKHGWQPVVVAPPSIPWEPDDPALAAQVPAGTPLYPVPYRQGTLFQRLALYSSWLPAAWRACRMAVEQRRPEAVLTSGPPHQVHLLGLALRERYGLPWVADFRDPWITDGRSRPPRDLRKRLATPIERRILHRADAIVANAPLAADALIARYPALRPRIVALPNGYDREAFDLPRPPRPAGAPIRVIHAGAIYLGRDPRPFLDAVRLLRVGPAPSPVPIEVVFYGPRPECDLDLDAEVRGRGLEGCVRVAGQVPYARTLREMVAADVLLLLDTPGRRIGVPAKAYEYIGAGRPVLALGEGDGDLAWALEESGTPHQIVPPDDPPEIARALAGLAREADARPARAPSASKFTRESLAARLADLLDRCTGGADVPFEAGRDRREPAVSSWETSA